jgi:hypothetical protein
MNNINTIYNLVFNNKIKIINVFDKRTVHPSERSTFPFPLKF